MIPGLDSLLDMKLITLSPSIVARWIRIYPFSEEPMFVCAKFSFYGCRFSAGLIEYKIPEGGYFMLSSSSSSSSGGGGGGVPITSLDLRDRCYDGEHDQRGNVLHGGLGCLTDSKVTNATPAASLSKSGATEECLIGWNRTRWDRSSGNRGVVDMIFRFQELRNFSSVIIYALDRPSQWVSTEIRYIITYFENYINLMLTQIVQSHF